MLTGWHGKEMMHIKRVTLSGRVIDDTSDGCPVG